MFNTILTLVPLALVIILPLLAIYFDHRKLKKASTEYKKERKTEEFRGYRILGYIIISIGLGFSIIPTFHVDSGLSSAPLLFKIGFIIFGSLIIIAANNAEKKLELKTKIDFTVNPTGEVKPTESSEKLQ